MTTFAILAIAFLLVLHVLIPIWCAHDDACHDRELKRRRFDVLVLNELEAEFEQARAREAEASLPWAELVPSKLDLVLNELEVEFEQVGGRAKFEPWPLDQFGVEVVEPRAADLDQAAVFMFDVAFSEAPLTLALSDLPLTEPRVTNKEPTPKSAATAAVNGALEAISW